MNEDAQLPVSAHVFLRRPGGHAVLLQRRASGYGKGRLALPAGHVKYGEIAARCAVRELGEELGLKVAPDRLRVLVSMLRRRPSARVDFFYLLDQWAGEPLIMEPAKCSELIWADPDELPSDVLGHVVEAWRAACLSLPFVEFEYLE